MKNILNSDQITIFDSPEAEAKAYINWQPIMSPEYDKCQFKIRIDRILLRIDKDITKIVIITFILLFMHFNLYISNMEHKS